MSEPTYPKPLRDVLRTLANVFEHQHKGEIVELLRSATGQFEPLRYDNWDGGMWCWAMRLEVPIPLFASAEARIGAIEKEITARLETYFNRVDAGNYIEKVTIVPLAPDAPANTIELEPTQAELGRLWSDGAFRLFVSHVSAHKREATRLKDELAENGICAFIAHKDIRPSLEWQREIELALQSMHALSALVTPDFHPSYWTDQEVGWAFGRGKLVLPVRLGIDPYGFMGKVQAVSGSLSNPAALAESITKALLSNPLSRVQMRSALVRAFCRSGSFATAKRLTPQVLAGSDFTVEETKAMLDACTANVQVAEAYGVTDAIHKRFGKPKAVTADAAEAPPF